VPPPDTSAQMAWEDAEQKVSLAVHGTPTNNPGPDQHSPLDRPTPTQGKKEKLSNKHGTVNKQARPEKAGGAAPAQQPWSGKACKSGRGRKTPQEREEDPHYM
jgi:hypothetical protein